jgi:hypothetical protein
VDVPFRPHDRLGVAAVSSGLSPDHRDYLAAGGLGFILRSPPTEIDRSISVYANDSVRPSVMVLTGSYLRWERITILLCLLDIAWIVIALKVRPSFNQLAHDTFVPSMPQGGLTPGLMFLVIAIVGTTIAPHRWQPLYAMCPEGSSGRRFSC